MNGVKANYVTVGVFVLAMAAALIVSLAVLMGRTGATDDYYTVYRNVTGVKFGTQVLYTPHGYEGAFVMRVSSAGAVVWQVRAPKRSWPCAARWANGAPGSVDNCAKKAWPSSPAVSSGNAQEIGQPPAHQVSS